MPAHHNDNRPRSPAEHRAILAAQRAGQDAIREPRNRGHGRPTFARLRRADAWREIQSLERYAEDEGVSLHEGMLHAANDNAPVDDTGRVEISRVDSRLDEENPTAEEMAAAAWADEKDRKEGRPEMANRILFDDKKRIIAVKVRGRYRSLVETFAEPRGPAEDSKDSKARISTNTGYSMPDELPDAQDEQARRLDHIAMKRRLGREVCRVLELALGDLTAEEIGTELGLKDKTAERIAVKLIDGAVTKLMAAYRVRDAADREAA